MKEPLDVAMDTAGIARVTINRPKSANAIDPALAASLHDAFEWLANDPKLRVLVLLGQTNISPLPYSSCRGHGSTTISTGPPFTTSMRSECRCSKFMPTKGCVLAACTSMGRGCPSQSTMAEYTSNKSVLPSASIPSSRPSQAKPSVPITAVGRVRSPLNPVSITPSTVRSSSYSNNKSCNTPAGWDQA